MRLLIIGNLKGHISAAIQSAMHRGAQVAQADALESGLEALRGGRGADMVMIDADLDVGGFMAALAAEHIAVPVVACGVGSDTSTAVRAIKAGAKEFVPLPPDPDLIAAVLEAVAAEDQDLIFRDPATQAVLQLAEQVAPADATVLITGESGTGKEVMARHIHAKSRRADKPFIALNCAAIPDNLLESELFGHEKGAFTGAVARRIGKFEEAHGGTLLLDEVTEMDPRLQAKLLRAIQEREIDRVGGTKPVKVDVRLIATSNRDLQQAVKEGQFREDLYFRLNVINVALPPLRERPRDVEVLAEHFIAKYAEANGVAPRPLSAAARQALIAYGWPGNVRELENTMHRAVLLAQGPEIEPAAIMLPTAQAAPPAGGAAAGSPGAPMAPAAMPPAAPSPDSDDAMIAGLVGRTVAQVEQQLILETLEHCLGNRTHAANILGISIRTLRNKLRQYSEEGVAIPQPGGGSAA